MSDIDQRLPELGAHPNSIPEPPKATIGDREFGNSPV
jgi:hypothetical protein